MAEQQRKKESRPGKLVEGTDSARGSAELSKKGKKIS